MRGTFVRTTTFLLAAACAASAGAQAPAAGAARPDSAKKKPLPLASARKISWTTSRGSWMSLDVSPDGRTIVFDLLGDLYSLPIAGGKATRLTNGMAFDAQPRFSPDGKKIVFVSDRTGGENLFLMTLDGKDTTQLTKGNNSLYVSPEWTPDGKYVVASKSGGLGGPAKLWMYHIEGGNGTAIMAPTPQIAAQKHLGAAFGPDGRYIWYARRTGDWQYNAILPQYQLVVYDRENGTATQMSDRYGSAFRPAISPDGKWLAYGSRFETGTGIRLRNLASGEEKWLAHPVQRDDQESRSSLDVLPGYSWTPDGTALVMSYGGEFWRVPVDGKAPVRIPFTADVEAELGPQVKFANKVDDSPTFTAKQIRDAVPSPDGKRLAFTVLDRLYVMDWPAGAPRRVLDVPGAEYMPTWSPDGRSVAFATWDDAKGGHIYKVRVDQRNQRPVQLTRTPALYHNLQWSPWQPRIVAVRAAARDMQEAVGFFGGGMGSQFVWVSTDGGDVNMIAPSGNRGAPHFGPDSARIYAYSFADGLVSFRWDGTDVKSHLKVTGPMLPQGIPNPGEPGFSSVLVDLPSPTLGAHTHLGDGHDQLENNPTPPPAGWVKISPTGEKALALVGSDLYVVTIPQVGALAPTISVASPENAAFPVRRLTDIGAQFPAWSRDGNRVHWSMGNAHVTYDLVRAQQVDDSLKQVARAKGNAKPEAAPAPAKTDSTGTVVQVADSTKKDVKPAVKPGYRPEEHRIAVAVQRDIPQGTAVLRGARVVTMKGNEVVEDADVVVRNNRIVAVGKRGSVEVPAGAQVVDVAGKTIVPGFVDTHYHAQWLIPGIHAGQVWQYLTNLAYGVTTTRDPQTATTDVLTYGDRVESGSQIGPRIYSTGPGVFIGEQIKDLDHARNVLKRYATYWDTKTIKMYMTGNRQQRQWVIMAAKELGLMPTTEGGLDFKLDITHAMDGYAGVEHSLPIAPLFEDVVRLFAESGTVNSPTLLVSYGGPFGENYWYTNTDVANDAKLKRFTPREEFDAKVRRRGTNSGGSPGPGGWFLKEEYVFPQHAQFVNNVVKAGGRMGVGSHGQLQGLGYQWELWSMAMGGVSNHEALRMATMDGAIAIGFENDIGSIEAGKLADLVVLDADPLEDIRNTNAIRYVMKNGRLYAGETLDEVYPTRKALPTQAWATQAPSGISAGIR